MGLCFDPTGDCEGGEEGGEVEQEGREVIEEEVVMGEGILAKEEETSGEELARF